MSAGRIELSKLSGRVREEAKQQALLRGDEWTDRTEAEVDRLYRSTEVDS